MKRGSIDFPRWSYDFKFAYRQEFGFVLRQELLKLIAEFQSAPLSSGACLMLHYLQKSAWPVIRLAVQNFAKGRYPLIVVSASFYPPELISQSHLLRKQLFLVIHSSFVSLSQVFDQAGP